MESLNNNQSYFEQRMQALGVTDQNNVVSIKRKGHISNEDIEVSNRYFETDDVDNIVINYFKLNKSRVKYTKPGNKWAEPFSRKRLKNSEGAMKYWQPKGSGHHPFFPPGILAKYAKKESIDTLVLTEGEFKAWKGDQCGFNIVGLPSIHGFYSGDIPGELHHELIELITACKVEKLVYLTDADTLTVNWKKDKDLSQRPQSFYSAVKYLRESVELLLDDDQVALANVYFMHIRSRYAQEEAKGLDDLLCKYTAKKPREEILNDLHKYQFAQKYFTGHIVTDGKLQRIYAYFGLRNESEFHTTYKAYIGSREFLFKNRRYEFNGETVKYVRHEDADKYMRIGPDWVKVITTPNKYGDPEEDIIPWKIGELTRDYKTYPEFLNQVPKYDAFCNEPNWNGEYRRVHYDCYNLCSPLTHEIREGEFPNTSKFLKHIFQGEGTIENNIIGDQFTVALDYLTLQFQKPKQMLPVPILVSPENGTGKSTFLKWLQAIYGANMAILGNDQFKMKFNAHYITKFIIAIDEGFLEVDKKAEKERLKQLATADTAYLENKGMNVKKFPYFGKLIICSNDADRVMKIEDGESRWFVVRVPVIPKEDKDPDLEMKLKKEIPAFLHFIANRSVAHDKTDRLWFSPDQFETEQFRIIVETTKNRLDRVFEDWIKDQFLTFKLPVLKYSISHLVEVLNDPKMSKYKVDTIELKTYLKDKRKLKPKDPRDIKIPIGWNNADSMAPGVAPTIYYKDEKARAYQFVVQEWLNEEELEEFNRKESDDTDESTDLPF